MVGIFRKELCREKAAEICLGFPLSMLETISGLQHGRGIQTEPGSLAEVKRMKLGRPRELELKGQSLREEELQRSA